MGKKAPKVASQATVMQAELWYDDEVDEGGEVVDEGPDEEGLIDPESGGTPGITALDEEGGGSGGRGSLME